MTRTRLSSSTPSEANAWSDDALRRAKERIALNREAREIDAENIEAYIKAGQ